MTALVVPVTVAYTVPNGTGWPAGYVNRPFDMQVNAVATDLDDTTVASLGIRSGFNAGLGNVPFAGKLHAFSAGGIVNGCGDDLSEFAAFFAAIRMDIGNGYPQATGPTGRGWLTDWNIHGPIGVQPHLLNGITLLYNNYYNGSPASSKGGAIWLVTRKGQGGGRDALHEAADTYPVDVGIGIVGTSEAGGVEGVGFKTAIQIGGNGSAWKIAGSSRIWRGVDICDHTDAAIHIGKSKGGAAIQTDADSGPIGLFGAQPVGQQPGGPMTAHSHWDANNQEMLQKVYDCLRKLGPLS